MMVAGNLQNKCCFTKKKGVISEKEECKLTQNNRRD